MDKRPLTDLPQQLTFFEFELDNSASGKSPIDYRIENAEEYDRRESAMMRRAQSIYLRRFLRMMDERSSGQISEQNQSSSSHRPKMRGIIYMSIEDEIALHGAVHDREPGTSLQEVADYLPDQMSYEFPGILEYRAYFDPVVARELANGEWD